MLFIRGAVGFSSDWGAEQKPGKRPGLGMRDCPDFLLYGWAPGRALCFPGAPEGSGCDSAPSDSVAWVVGAPGLTLTDELPQPCPWTPSISAIPEARLKAKRKEWLAQASPALATRQGTQP